MKFRVILDTVVVTRRDVADVLGELGFTFSDEGVVNNEVVWEVESLTDLLIKANECGGLWVRPDGVIELSVYAIMKVKDPLWQALWS